jgi:hypothetical protein
MSNGQNVDSEGEYTYYSWKEIDSLKSRRVAFRVITNSEGIIEKINKKEKIIK